MKLADTVLEELWFDGYDDEGAELEASESMAAKLAELAGLKPFPVVAQKVLRILANPDFRVVAVTNALEEDPALAAGLLRMANSAYYAGTKSCASIQQAFVRLGSRSVREVVFAVASLEMFPDTDGLGKKVRDHCAATAAIVHTLARELAPKFTEGVFLAGLMHDIGKMLLIETGEIVYAGDNPEETLKPDRIHVDERKILGYDHAVLAGHVLKGWNIPDPIPKMVAWHHQPARAYQDSEVGMRVALLRIADHLDAIFRDTPEEQEPRARALAEKADCDFAGITAEGLRNQLPSLFEARVDALSMFGG
jgi:putative nucleotidyltransferase with HDIG domain